MPERTFACHGGQPRPGRERVSGRAYKNVVVPATRRLARKRGRLPLFTARGDVLPPVDVASLFFHIQQHNAGPVWHQHTDLIMMSGPNYSTDKQPSEKPPIENQPAPRGAFNEGRHTGAGAIKSREIFRENVKPVPEARRLQPWTSAATSASSKFQHKT